jgi:CYTH domain-containing protein
MHTFVEPNVGLTVLETESDNLQREIKLPDWMQAKEEVTTDDLYSSFVIAKNRTVPKKQ